MAALLLQRKEWAILWNDVQRYIRRRRYTLTAILLSFLVFSVVLLLYQVPMEAVLYGIVIVSVTGCAFLCHGFGKFRKKRELVSGLAERIENGLEFRDLPEAEDALEEAYQELLEGLLKEKQREKARADERENDMVEYYTLWAHQIKTPIAAMSLLLQEESSQINAELAMELFQIEQYVEMVLQYLRLGSESSDLVLRAYDLDECIRQAVRKYAKNFIRKKIILDFTETECKVITDEKWLVFVLEQLLSNALKYTKEGTIRIYWKSGFLYIEDTGIGITAEDLPRIFEKGYTGYNGRKDKKSTGIGLYLCREILERLSHHIEITSTLGQGTRVCLDLRREVLEFD